MPFPAPGRSYCDICQPIAREQSQKSFRVARLKKLGKYKRAGGCIVCGYNKCAAALHFHHVETKEHRVWIPSGKEFEKCILLCANCHFEIHEKIAKNGDVY